MGCHGQVASRLRQQFGGEAHVVRSPEFLDRCDLLDDVHFDVTRILEPALAETIDAKVRERSQAKKRARTVWRTLQQPAGLVPDLWLNLDPIGGKCQPYWLG